MISNPAGCTPSSAGSARTSATAGARVVGLTPDAEVGLLYSARSKWGLAFQAAFPKPGAAFVGLAGRRRPAVVPPDLRGVLPRHLRRRGRRPDRSTTASSSGPTASASTPAELAAELPVLIVPGLLVADDELLTWLRATPPPAAIW